MPNHKIYIGDTLEVLKTLPDESVDCIITSPPYWGLRDYGVEGQIGLEPTLEEYLQKLLAITKELKRVLKPTGVMFWNMGTNYSNGKAIIVVKEWYDKNATYCRRCVCIVRNKSIRQREIVRNYWKGKFRDKWLEKWNTYGKIKSLNKNDVSTLNENWIKLLAWILTDGTIRKRWGIVVIYQKKKNMIREIKNILNHLDLKYSLYESKKDGTKMFYIHSKSSRKIIEKLGLEKCKKLPSWTKYLSKSQLKVFVKTLIKGDGHKRKYDTVLYGKKEQLQDIFNLLISKNIGCTLNKNHRGDWYIQIHQNQL